MAGVLLASSACTYCTYDDLTALALHAVECECANPRRIQSISQLQVWTARRFVTSTRPDAYRRVRMIRGNLDRPADDA